MITKKQLEARFCSEEAIGVTYGPYEGDDNIAMLPGSFGRMGTCTNCARYVAELIPNTVVAGFLVENNKACTHEDVVMAGGHDFAIVEKRFIVDLWISLYTGAEAQVVYDCLDPRDRSKIHEIFGDPLAWGVLIDDRFTTQNPKDPVLSTACLNVLKLANQGTQDKKIRDLDLLARS